MKMNRAVLHLAGLALIASACSAPYRSRVLDIAPSRNPTEMAACLTRRAAMDVGSGSTKLKVATIDKCQARILTVLFSGQIQLSLKENIHRERFSPEFVESAASKIVDFAKEAEKFDVSLPQIVAIGTQALREAQNSADLINRLKRSQLHLRVISQVEEAELGHRAAGSDTEKDAKKVTSFDIGGGSFQIVSLQPKTDIIGGHLASVSFKDHIVERIQRRPRGSSPNPIHPKTAISAIAFAENYARNLMKKHPDFQFQKTIIGVGGVFGFSIAQQLGKSKFKLEDLEDLYPKLISRRSEDIESDFRETETTNVLLVIGLLRGFDLTDNEIEIKKANLADAVLTTTSYYK